MSGTEGLLPEALAIIHEEESLLARALASIARAEEAAARQAGRHELRSDAQLRALRDQANAASADDLPMLLHEMEVRQQLRQRSLGGQGALPDPRAPYLAHLRLREGHGGKAASRDYLLGHHSFVDVQAGIRIVDWRVAPVAQIFYNYREGDPFEEEFPGRVAEGVVEARRVLVISGGELRQIVGDHVVLIRGADGAWTGGERGALSLQPGGAGTAARPESLGTLGVGIGAAGRIGHAGHADVTALLDAEQYAAVAAPAEQPLLVLGSAGSGKTTVALHRLARIAALDAQRYPLSRMMVVVPEEGLARLSARLLQPMGGGAAQVRTLDAWARELLHEVFGDPAPKLDAEPPALVSRLKRHPALYDALHERLARARLKGAPLKRLRRVLADVFTDRSFLQGVVAASAGDLPMGVVEETVRHTMLQLADSPEQELALITDEERKKALDGRALWEGTPAELAGTLDVEDLPVLLCLRAWGEDLPARTAAHLVLDEAEDFSLFELLVLGRLLGETRSVTLAGDEAQQTHSSFAGWHRSLDTLGVAGVATCRLAVSYRCPRQVTELARQVLGSLAPESPARAAREGAPVGRFHFPDEAQAQLLLSGAVKDLIEREPLASVAVIAHSVESARRFHRLITEIGDLPDARLVLTGEFSFAPGIDVTDVDNAKGLEFDYVVVPDATEQAYPQTHEARRRLHVAITRTSHQLWAVSSGTPSPLLAPPSAAS